MHNILVLKKLEYVIYCNSYRKLFKQIHVYINYIFLIKILKTKKCHSFFRFVSHAEVNLENGDLTLSNLGGGGGIRLNGELFSITPKRLKIL